MDYKLPYIYTLGELSFSSKDVALAPIKFDRLAYWDGRLLFSSLFAEKSRIKQLRALLMPGVAKNVHISYSRVNSSRPSVYPGGDQEQERASGLSVSPDGYRLAKKDLDFGMCHAMFISKNSGFMLVPSHMALLKQIKRSSVKDPITTPFIPEWLEYAEQALKSERLLVDCWCYRCNCMVFSGGTSSLEQIVSVGLSSGAIAIPPPPESPRESASVGFSYSRNCHAEDIYDQSDEI